MGDTGTARSLRTQQGILSIQRRIAGTDGLPGKGFDVVAMREVLFSGPGRVAGLTRNDAATMCAAFPGGTAPSGMGPVPVGPPARHCPPGTDVSRCGAYLAPDTALRRGQAVTRNGVESGARRPGSTLMTHSQSSDPTSPHFSDQPRLCCAGKWVSGRFTLDQALALPALRVTVLR